MAKVLNIAHRGASGYAPENTIKAFHKALNLGADMIEIDVRRTRDKQLVVFHDFMLSRLTRGRGRLRKYRFHELKRFDIGGEEIPRLLDVLSLLKGKCQINIEIKERGLVKDIVEAVKKNGMEKDVLFSSFLHFELLKIKAIDGKLRIALLFATNPPSLNIVMKLAKEMQAEALTFQIKNMRRNYLISAVREAEKINCKVNVWTANDVEDIEWLKEVGVHGIISDYPDRI